MAEAKSDAQGNVVVCSALPRGHVFTLSDGKTVRIAGRKLSALVGPQAEPLSSGRYGKTTVPAALWERVKEEHKDCPFWTGNVMFVEQNESRANARAKEQSADVKTGLEQVDPKKTKTTPKTDD